MKLEHLLYAELFRDGGSLEASFRTVDGKTWTVSLEIDPRSLASPEIWPRPYAGLYECELNTARKGEHAAIAKGSEREREIVDALTAWVAAHGSVSPPLDEPRDPTNALELLEVINASAPEYVRALLEGIPRRLP